MKLYNFIFNHFSECEIHHLVKYICPESVTFEFSYWFYLLFCWILWFIHSKEMSGSSHRSSNAKDENDLEELAQEDEFNINEEDEETARTQGSIDTETTKGVFSESHVPFLYWIIKETLLHTTTKTSDAFALYQSYPDRRPSNGVLFQVSFVQTFLNSRNIYICAFGLQNLALLQSRAALQWLKLFHPCFTEWVYEESLFSDGLCLYVIGVSDIFLLYSVHCSRRFSILVMLVYP